MKHYLITFLWSAPYPREAPYRIEASNLSAALGKAVRQFRKENKGQRITKGIIKFQQYASSSEHKQS